MCSVCIMRNVDNARSLPWQTRTLGEVTACLLLEIVWLKKWMEL